MLPLHVCILVFLVPLCHGQIFGGPGSRTITGYHAGPQISPDGTSNNVAAGGVVTGGQFLNFHNPSPSEPAPAPAPIPVPEPTLAPEPARVPRPSFDSLWPPQPNSVQPSFGDVCIQSLSRRNNKDLYPDPSDCHFYIQCSYYNETYAEGTRLQCQQGLFWHDQVRQCIPEGRVRCQDRCLDDGTQVQRCFAGTGCRQFFQCANTASRGMCCPDGTSFKESTCSCEHDYQCYDQCIQEAQLVPISVLPPQIVTHTNTIYGDNTGNMVAGTVRNFGTGTNVVVNGMLAPQVASGPSVMVPSGTWMAPGTIVGPNSVIRVGSNSIITDNNGNMVATGPSGTMVSHNPVYGNPPAQTYYYSDPPAPVVLPDTWPFSNKNNPFLQPPWVPAQTVPPVAPLPNTWPFSNRNNPFVTNPPNWPFGGNFWGKQEERDKK